MWNFRLYMYLVRYRRRVNRHPKIDPLMMRFLEVCFPYAIGGFPLSDGGAWTCPPLWSIVANSNAASSLGDAGQSPASSGRKLSGSGFADPLYRNLQQLNEARAQHLKQLPSTATT